MSSDSTNAHALGSSLTVPIVQELARSGEIPERYIRPEANSDPVASAAGDDDLPLIDLMKLLDPGRSGQEELSRLGSACREWGFFQLINYGIPEEVIEKTKDDLMKFFKLPLREREAVKQLPGSIEGYGQMFVHSEEQKLDWADTLILGVQPFQNRDLRFWPANPVTFRDTLDKYTSEIKKIADCLFRFMAEDLGINVEAMTQFLSRQRQSVRINYYPPCEQANKVLGLSPHSDGSALTLLLQVNDINGLQIKKNDEWFLIKPKPEALIVNIGDTMEIMTNGKYKSIEHRAIINREERLSIATFQLPSLNTILCPFPELVNDEGVFYKTISFEEFTKEYFSRKLDGKNTLESMKLKK